MIREELVLRQISREVYGASYYTRAMIEASMINAVEPQSKSAAYKRARDLVMEGAAMTAFYSQAALERICRKGEIETKQGMAALKIIDHSNLFDIFSKAVKPDDWK